MLLADLAGRRVVVWAPGVEGRALAGAAVRLAPPASLLFVHDDPARVTAEARAEIGAVGGELAPVADAPWHAVDVLVRTAGVSRYRPEVQRAIAAGVARTTPTALWFAEFAERRVVAVTGTKGKSTTAALVHHLLAGIGEPAVLAGNMGEPLGRPLATLHGSEDDAKRFVVEVSSHQTADLDTSPELAVVTNLSPDHLPWHGGDVETYYRDKLNLLAHRPSMTSVLNAADAELSARAAAAPHPVWFCGDDGYRIEGSTIVGPDGRVAAAADLQLRGRFNLENCCAALAAVAAWGVAAPAGRLGELLAGFAPLPGRFEVVGRHGGVDLVADALASNPAGAAAAVRAVAGRRLALIVGGQDRGVSFAELAAAVARHRGPVALVAVPDNGLEIGTAIAAARADIQVISAEDVAAAARAAADLAAPDGVVLFAPGAPTPDRLGSYAQRTAAFRAAAEALSSQ